MRSLPVRIGLLVAAVILFRLAQILTYPAEELLETEPAVGVVVSIPVIILAFGSLYAVWCLLRTFWWDLRGKEYGEPVTEEPDETPQTRVAEE